MFDSEIMNTPYKNKISNFLAQPFPLLQEQRSKWFLVIFCGVFSTFFLVFYKPLNIVNWNHDTAIANFLTSWSAGMLGAIILGITQFVVRPKLNLTTFTNGQFISWVLFEFLLLTCVFFVLFGERKNPMIAEFLSVLKLTVSLASIPYFLACLLIAVGKPAEKKQIASPPPPVRPPLEQHIFKDENGKTVLAVKPNKILLLKSEKNYVSVYYLENDVVEKKLIRTNLKTLVQDLLPYPELIRIHRSYIVNLQYIASVERKKGGFQLKISHLPEMPLTVTDKYRNTFEKVLSS